MVRMYHLETQSVLCSNYVIQQIVVVLHMLAPNTPIEYTDMVYIFYVVCMPYEEKKTMELSAGTLDDSRH